MTDITDILRAAREITVTGMALVGVIALVKGWVVTKPHHDEVRAIYEARLAMQAEIIRKLRNGSNPPHGTHVGE